MSTPSSGRYDLLDRLAEEFAGRYRRGERPAVQEYIDRHPDLADDIRGMFAAVVQVERAEDDRHAGDEPAEGLAASPPRRVGDYRILREVGRGGMGVVYEAEQVSLGRRVALKVLPSRAFQDRVTLGRFRREARSAAKLHHTNIVPVFEVGQEGEVSYYAMQFIQGQGLDLVIEELGRLRRRTRPEDAAGPGPARPAAEASGPEVAPPGDPDVGPVARSLLTGRFDAPPVDGASPFSGASTPSASTVTQAEALSAVPVPPPSSAGASAETASSAVLPGGAKLSTAETGRGHQYHRSVARIGQQAAEALAHAHARGIIHRDIKPANLLLDTAGVVWVADFGLARAEDDGLTRTGDILGTLRYMAPERFRGEGDGRADVYALGLTLYELLTLRPAFDAGDRARLIERIKGEEPPRPRSVDPRVPRDLETIVLKAIEKDPKRRYQTAEELAEDLRRFLDREAIRARSVGPLERAWIWARRRPAIAGLLGLVALSSATGLTGVLWQWRDATVQRNLAMEGERLANLRLAQLAYERGQAACEQGEFGPGLVRMVQSWRAAVDAREPDWRRVARVGIAAWQPHFPRPQRTFQLGGGAATKVLGFSRDGRTILAGSQLWDAETGQPISGSLRREGEPHFGGLDYHRGAFSPDGKTAVAGGRIWDVATRCLIGPASLHDGWVSCVSFRQDGEAVVTGGFDKAARLWKTRTGEQIGKDMPHEGIVWAAEFSSDGKNVVTASNDGAVRFWDASTGELLGTPLQIGSAVVVMEFSTDGTTILTGSEDGKARLWDAKTRQRVGEEMIHGEGVKGAAFSLDGKAILTASFDGTARLWDARTGAPIGDPLRHDAQVSAVAFSLDNTLAVTGSHDGTARLWDARTGQSVGVPLPHNGPIRDVEFSPDGLFLLTASDDAKAKLWDLATVRGIVGTVRRLGDPVRSVAFRPVGPTALTSSTDGRLRLRDVATGEFLGEPIEHGGPIRSAAFSPDGKTVLTGSMNGTAQLWDVATGRRIGAPIKFFAEILAVAFSPDGKLAIVGGKGSARLLDAKNAAPDGGPLDHGDDWVSAAAFSRDGRTVITADFQGTARLWDVVTRRRIGPEINPEVASTILAVAISPDGKTALTGCDDRRARLWDVATGRAIGAAMQHRGPIDSAAFSPDGRAVLIGSIDGTAQLWDVATGKLIGAPMMHGGPIRSVAFSPDGRAVLIGSRDGTTRLCPVEDLPDDLPRVAAQLEALTGLSLDSAGSIRQLDRDARSAP